MNLKEAAPTSCVSWYVVAMRKSGEVLQTGLLRVRVTRGRCSRFLLCPQGTSLIIGSGVGAKLTRGGFAEHGKTCEIAAECAAKHPSALTRVDTRAQLT